MGEMVDRVAAAICVANASEANNYTELARAAIAAMRNPTDAMMDAALVGFKEEGGLLTVDDLLGAYVAAIDAALKEGE